MEMTERKHWIDNLRWLTIIVVVIFHVFFYYNNIGVEKPMFKGLAPNPAVTGDKAALTFAGIFQYSVYQWFMLLLFIISGICAKFTLKTKSVKEFIKSRTLKLLVPSTLGVLTIQWLSGLINIIELGGEELANTPMVVKYVIAVLSGTGALWFCHVLYIASLLLALIKVIDRKGKFENLCSKSNIYVVLGFYFVMFGAAQILNLPMVSTYRMCYYPVAFLSGYYIFSNDKILLQLKVSGPCFLISGIATGFFYIRKFYGISYSDYSVLNSWLSILHAWLTVIGIIGTAQLLLNFRNSFTDYMNKAGWGIYVNHIIIMQVTNILLKPLVGSVPFFVIYLIEFAASLAVSIALWEVFKRIPVIRYVLYGIKGKKKSKATRVSESSESKVNETVESRNPEIDGQENN